MSLRTPAQCNASGLLTTSRQAAQLKRYCDAVSYIDTAHCFAIFWRQPLLQPECAHHQWARKAPVLQRRCSGHRGRKRAESCCNFCITSSGQIFTTRAHTRAARSFSGIVAFSWDQLNSPLGMADTTAQLFRADQSLVNIPAGYRARQPEYLGAWPPPVAVPRWETQDEQLRCQ